MKVAIIGSRNFPDAYVRVRKCIIKNYKLYGNGLILLSGGSGSVDNAAYAEAITRGIPIHIYPANWNKYGNRAAYLRNKRIVKLCDIVYAFWDGRSPGTSMVIQLAKEMGKELVIRRPEKGV